MPYHDGIHVWEVEIPVIGPVKINRRFSLIARKELQTDEPFYSHIYIEPQHYGFLIRLSAYAPNEYKAEIAGLVFLGRMLDVLSLNCDISIAVLNDKHTIEKNNSITTRRILDQNDFKKAFTESRKLIIKQPTFLRALGWYRKGKYTTDPLDKFLAFWNSIETVASKYNPHKDYCSNRGSICHIWECFKELWGECESWPIIANQNDWIDKGNEYRKDIAHGLITTDIESLTLISQMSIDVEKVSNAFLYGWHENLELDVENELMR